MPPGLREPARDAARPVSVPLRLSNEHWSDHLAKPNYAFAKRQRDLAKKQKKEAKRLRKTEPVEGSPAPESTPPPEKPTP